MSVLAVLETFSGTGAHENDMRVTEYDRTFDVVVSSLADTPDTILAAVDPATFLAVPQIGDLWLPSPTIPRIAKCKDRRPRRNSQNPYQWEVALQYGTDWQRSDPDPTKRPPKVRGETVTYREAAAQGYEITGIDLITGLATVDDAPSAILNSAGDPFDPPPEKDASRHRITITRYELANPDTVCDEFLDTVNMDEWRGYKAGCAKYSGYSYEGPEYFNGIAYYLVTHTVDCRKASSVVITATEGWGHYVPDNGYRERVADANVPTGWSLREIRDPSSGSPCSSPQLLNGFGKRQTIPPPGTSPNVVYLGWRIYEMSDFPFALNLPQSP